MIETSSGYSILTKDAATLGSQVTSNLVHTQQNQRTPFWDLVVAARLLLKVKWSEVAQPCPTLCNPMDCSLPRFSVHGIFQARVLEWVAISFSKGSSRPRDRTWVSSHCRQTLYCLSYEGRQPAQRNNSCLLSRYGTGLVQGQWISPRWNEPQLNLLQEDLNPRLREDPSSKFVLALRIFPQHSLYFCIDNPRC